MGWFSKQVTEEPQQIEYERPGSGIPVAYRIERERFVDGRGSAAIDRFGDKPAYLDTPARHHRRRETIDDSLSRAPTVAEHNRMKWSAKQGEKITPYPKVHRNGEGHYPPAPKESYYEHPAFDYDYQNRDPRKYVTPGHTRVLTDPNKNVHGVSYHPPKHKSDYVRADEGYARTGLDIEARKDLTPQQLDWYRHETDENRKYLGPRRVPSWEANPPDPRRQASMVGDDALAAWKKAPRAPRLPRPAPRWPSPPPPR